MKKLSNTKKVLLGIGAVLASAILAGLLYFVWLAYAIANAVSM